MDDQLPKPINPSTANPDDSQSQAVQPSDNSTVAAVPQDDAINPQGLSAEDIDLIEKEWVTKAKKIVESTQGDPYKQSQELNKVKAEYIKKRYDKSIKTEE